MVQGWWGPGVGIGVQGLWGLGMGRYVGGGSVGSPGGEWVRGVDGWWPGVGEYGVIEVQGW